MAREESPARMQEEGLSMRDAGRALAESMTAVAGTLALVAWLGPLGWLALPVSAWIFWKALHREPEPVAPGVSWLPADSAEQWLDDAYASWQRGTGISTLAVRYGVEAGWLEAQLAERERA